MPTFEPGDRVRLDITDTTDPDFEWHGQHGQVVEVLEGDAGEVTGDDRDSRLYRVDLDDHDHTPSTFVTATSDRLLRTDRYALYRFSAREHTAQRRISQVAVPENLVCFDYLNLVVCGLFKIFDRAVNRDV